MYYHCIVEVQLSCVQEVFTGSVPVYTHVLTYCCLVVLFSTEKTSSPIQTHPLPEMVQVCQGVLL